MKFTFLHAADLHLGSPFVGLSGKDDEIAARFAAASRQAFSDLVSRALELQVAFVLIAGDVYDGEWRDTSIGLFFQKEVARLDRARIPVFLLKGNHDAESVVTKAITLPAGVRQFPSQRATTFWLEDLKVAVHGRSFADRVVSENLVLQYPAPTPGWFNVGMLHTSCDGRAGHATYAPCTVSDLSRLGYQYWALGHVHEYEEVARDPWIVYPGNLQGRSLREAGAKGAVLVEVADQQVVAVERLIVDRARWATVEVDLQDLGDESAALKTIEEAIRPHAGDAQGRLLALRVRLAGDGGLAGFLQGDAHRLRDEVQAAAHRCHEDVWIERVRVELREEGGRPAIEGPSSMPDLAARLEEIAGEPEIHEAAAGFLAAIGAKTPAGIEAEDLPGAGDLDTLVAEARALLLRRLAG